MIDRIVAFVKDIPTNLYAVFVICTGAILVLCKHEEAGKAAMASGFTLLSHKS